jgi:hypothetical protein
MIVLSMGVQFALTGLRIRNLIASARCMCPTIDLTEDR